jgi:glycosyltransferase involved in cell wall biosynthesis
MNTRRLSIVHGPVNVGNLPWTLSGQMKALGHDSRVVVNHDTWLHYPADRVVGALGDTTLRNRLARASNGVAQSLGRDVLHYYFGRTFFTWDDLPGHGGRPLADMKLAKALGKRVVMTYQGCDARLAARSDRENEVTMCRSGACPSYEACVSRQDGVRRHIIEEVDRLADLVLYVNPELGHVVPRGSFLPYGNVDLEALRPSPRAVRDKPVILHAPSDPAIKGTRQIAEALDALRTEFEFEFRLVQGLSHAEALALYADADLLVDQLLAGWYGGLAVELMAMGKPVACYIREEDIGFVPAGMRAELPILRIHPHTLVDDLRRVLSNREQWVLQGARSRQFVQDWHDPRKLAQVLLGAYVEPGRYDELLAAMGHREGERQ